MKKFLFILFILFIFLIISCSKEEYCYLYTFSSVKCENKPTQVINRHKTNYLMDKETCEEMRDRIIKERANEVFLWKGHEISIEELIYCDCN